MALTGMLFGKSASSVTLISSLNPSTYGSSVTFTATITPSAATGTVTFKDGSTTLGTGTISGGKATYSSSKPAAGSHSITASYGGDSNYNSSASTALTQTVNQANTTVTLTSSANPSAYGSTVSFTAMVTPATATGTVTFKDGSTTLGTGALGNGVAIYGTFTLALGSHSITASYGGDTNDKSGTSSVLTQTVNKASTTVTLASSANPSTYGSSVTLTAKVMPAAATGTVTFKDGSTTLGTGTISSGTATYSTAMLLTGPHSITAAYGGDTNDNSSTSSVLTQTVNKVTTTVALASSADPSTYGSSVTLTATVTSSSATGTVTFMDGSTTLGTGMVLSGKATYSTSALTGGSHSMTAVYGGDSNNSASTSPAVTQTVTRVNSSVTLSSSANPSTYGSSVTFTATVTPNTATGTVTFKDGSTTLGTGTISGGIAAYNISTLVAGSHSITASYGGDTNYNSSASTTLTQTVNKANTTAVLASSLNPSAYGSSVTLTATVTPSTATGTVTFADGGTTLGTGAISGGIATYSTSVLAVGPHSVGASYGGDANYNSSASTTLTQTVNKANTTVALASGTNPSAYGSSVTLTATVTPSTATGTVTFADGGTTLGTGTISGGIATYSISTLAVGPHSVGASYGGNTNYNSNSSTTLTQTVNKANTTVALGSSVNPSAYGSPVTLTATVTPATATGTVMFADGGTTLGTGTISSGIATYSTSTLAVGPHSITASYGGDTNYNSSTSTSLTQTVNKANTSVALASGVNPSVYGSPVTLTATVTPATATGTVTFADGGTTLGTGTISGGVATYGTSTLSAGPHSITAAYGGDSGYNSSASTALTQTVNKANTAVALASSVNPSVYGSAVTLTATVTPATATGTVTFADGGTTLGTGAISGGVATYNTSALAAGPHSITASYGGDANYVGGSSTTLTQTVNKANATVALASGTNPSAYGSPVTLTATVTPSTATGTVTFADGGTTLGTGTISGGIATYSTSALAVGPHSVTASYGGDSSYNGSSSTTLTQTVNKANTIVALASGTNPSAYGSSVTLTATVTPSTATGTVTFADGGTTLGTGTMSGGIATYSTSTLAVGPHSITASYGGDTNYNSIASTTLTQTVSKANTTVALASGTNPSAYGSSVTLTATVTPSTATGTVTFADGGTTLGTGTISGGIATYSTSTLAVGPHSITASYGGDTNYNSIASTTLTQTVNKANPTVALASGTNPTVYGSSATFAATVTPATATGTVTFKDGGTMLGTGTISGGIATLSTSTLAVGPHSITASYGGDANYNSSASTTLTQTVNKANTSVALASGVNPSSYGSPVTLTATVTPATATGTVTFADGGTTLGTGTISGGIATYSTSALVSGPHSITASYGGDINYNSNLSTTLTQTVNKANTTVALGSSVNPSAYGSPVTLTATVTPATATGTATFADGGTTLGTGAISGGVATYSTSALAVGPHSITASYGGDANYIGSATTTLTQTVNKLSTTMTLASSANPSTYGSPVTLTATLTTGTGTVTFTDGSTTLGTGTIASGTATYSTSALGAGSHSITASYGGDTNDTSTSATLTQTVNKQNTAVTLASSVNPSTYGFSATFTATVTPATATGTVTFTDGSTTLGTGTIGSGTATYITTTLPAGPHSITASYGGDTNYNSSASPALGQTINAAPQVVTKALSSGTAGVSYSSTLAATGGTAPSTWSISSGSLPAGLSLNANTGAITGTPTVEGASNFTVQMTDADSITATQPLSIVVTAVINALSPTFGPVGTAVTISGAGFGTTPGTVTFNGVAATTVTSWGATSIVVAAPTGTGAGSVVVTVGGASSNGITFTTTTGATQANLNTSRYRHSATTLNNGQILVAAGINCPTSGSCTYLSSAELYNPATSAFTHTGSMGVARSAPAVILSTGKVLIAGGYTCDASGNCSSLNSAEVYDPAAGTFSDAGTMKVARSRHTMTVLGNGTVLIAGGENCTSTTSCSALSSAEIYDPNAGTFTPTSNTMGAARFGASAVLLDSGFVLIAGGFDGANLPAAAEIYNPAAGIGFTVTGPSLSVPRFDASATLLNNGQVLVSGGSTCSLPGCPTNAAEIYDPGANTFSVVTGGMIVPRFHHTATLLTNGEVIVAGGYSSCGSSCSEEASTELFDPVAGAFTSAQPLANAMAGHSATLLANGNVLLIGGINAGVTLAGDQLYEPTSLTPPGLVSIAVSPANSTLMPGQSEPLVATGTFGDGSTQTLHSVIWSSSNPSVAAIGNPGGIANAQATGASTMTATAGAVSGSTSLNVLNQVSTTLTSSANPSAFGSPVTLTATVTPATATGTVTFTDGGTTLGMGTIGSGTATYSTSALAVGPHALTASYGGDANDSSSTSTTLAQTINQASTTVALASAANPSAYGSSVTLTATVTPGTATGTVTFADGSTTLGTGAIGSGIAAYSTSALAVGPHSITASYGGDTNDGGSTSITLAQTVNQAGTALALGSSANPSAYGSPATFTATVTPATATGTVTFTDGSATLGTGAIGSGVATYSTSALAAGPHSITASYGGDTNDSGSASTTLTQTVNKASTTVTVASSTNPSGYGSAATFTATVVPATATGTVTFTDGSTTLGTGTIGGGTATYSTTTLATGPHSIAASYGGDSNDSSSASTALTQTVNQTTTTVALASGANPSAYGSSVTLTATVTPATATGTVTFTDGSTTLGTGTIGGGTATYSTTTLAAGPHSITASYGGDTNDSSSASTTLTQTINQGNTTVALASSANPSAYGSSVTLTATVTPATATGTVTFKDGSTTLGTGTVGSGIASYGTSALAGGPHSITASYGGDTNDSSSASSALIQNINSIPQVVTTSLSGGTAGASYSATLAASGGATPYTWSIVSGSLPAGLSLNTSTGAIIGTPTEEESSNFTVQATDASNVTATQPLNITVTPLLTYLARTDNCVNGTQSGCVAHTTTGEAGASLLFQERVNDPIPPGFAPSTISSGSCPSGWKPSTYPAYCPAPMNSTGTDPDFGAFLVMATDENTFAHNASKPYTVAWHMGSDGGWDAFSWDETLLLAKNTAGSATVLNISPAAIHAHNCGTPPGCVNQTGIFPAASGGGDSTHLAHGGSWSFSRVASEPHVIYEIANVPTQVNQLVINSSISSPGTGSLSRSIYVDFASDTPVPCSVMQSAAPGNPTTYAAAWIGSFQVANDGTISYGMTGGYDWAASWTVTPIDTFIQPTVGNVGNYGFQATAVFGTGTTGTFEPAWCQTAGCTVTDGGVTWTNIDKLQAQGQGFDMVIYRPAGTPAAGCTRINTRLGKIYRGTGNTAPAGYMSTNDQVVCTRVGTWPTVPCRLPDRFALHEVEQAQNGQYTVFSPNGSEGVNAPGNWNSGTLSCQASNTSWQGAYAPSNAYTIRNIVSYSGLYYSARTSVPAGAAYAPSGTTATNAYWSNTESYCAAYFFDTTSTLVAPLTDWVNGTGHTSSGYLHRYYGHLLASMLYGVSCPTCPAINGQLNPGTQMLLTGLPSDNHGTYRNSGTSDLTPIFTATTDVPAWTSRYVAACYDELCAFDPGGSGLTYRFGHTYNTGSSQFFAVQNNIGVDSPLGDLIAFGSDMMGTRGSNAVANAACNNLRGQYLPTPGNTVTYMDLAFPVTANGNENVFQATGCGTNTAGATCTEGATLPKWDSQCSTTCTDGGVTWTNIGPNSCRGDLVILDTLGAHAAP
jgi:hypothetical protein